jgi:hypothetical protein
LEHISDKPAAAPVALPPGALTRTEHLHLKLTQLAEEFKQQIQSLLTVRGIMTTKDVLKHFVKEIKATPDGKRVFTEALLAVAKRRKRPDGEVEAFLPEHENRRR